ncbi:AI-2E family transporter [Halomonas alkalicola]|uniref:AI-2E family transporter n=1 Tax=Halomonas alkalicola TaxID=1930622 RepID=A0ABY9H753_9GAMM|nr:AI-2E family transporter [Halomonas alkalicola]WLI74326.1 AI-2E family transporter [Halomonas alkalicola]
MYDHHGSPILNPLWVIAIILIVAALYWLRVLAAPMAFSLFLMALVWPVYQHRAFKGRRALRGLALIVSVMLVLVATAAFLLLIGYGARTVAVGLSLYGERAQETYRAIGLWLEGRGVGLWPTAGDPFSPNGLFHLVHEAVLRINAIMGFVALTLIFLILGLLEASAFQHRLPHALGADAADRLLRAFHILGWKFRRYMLVRTAVSVLTGLLTWIFALMAGLDFAIAWGILAFALNYIPFVGSILAVFPPVLFAIVQFESWQTPALVLLGMTLIQFSIGNLLDPRLEGRALAVSPFAVVFSIFFWGMLWGIPGAFMGVPLTIAFATVCNHFHDACWITRLLTPHNSPAKAKRSG